MRAKTRLNLGFGVRTMSRRSLSCSKCMDVTSASSPEKCARPELKSKGSSKSSKGNTHNSQTQYFSPNLTVCNESGSLKNSHSLCFHMMFPLKISLSKFKSRLQIIHSMQKTTKIENDHADEQIEVEGSSISSKTQENAEHDEFQQNQQPARQNANAYENQRQVTVQGAYEPAQYSNLPISADLKELFKSIQRYTPVLHELDTRLKAFVPEYIPAIGQVDAFLKMPRPDGQPETLGLYVLDEPALNQSDKAKIDLQLINNNKQYRGGKNSKVHAIESAEKNPKQILAWISSVGDIHKTKQPPSVSYSKPMPDIDTLMQEWPAGVEEALAEVAAPSEEIDLSLSDYSKVACNILDIPVYQGLANSQVEALHVMFTLYSAFKQNQHFNVNQENESYAEANR